MAAAEDINILLPADLVPDADVSPVGPLYVDPYGGSGDVPVMMAAPSASVSGGPEPAPVTIGALGAPAPVVRVGDPTRADAIFQGAKKDKARREQEQAAAQAAAAADVPAGAGQQMSDSDWLKQQGLDLIGLAGQSTTVTGPRPLYNERGEMITAGETANVQRSDAARELLTQQEETARYMAQQQEQLALDKSLQVTVEETAQREAQEREARIMRDIEMQDARITRAAQQLGKAPPEDPGRWWKDQSAGRKAGFILGSIFMGLAGQNPLALINGAIARDIEAQRSDYARRKDAIAVEGQRLEQKHNVYMDIRANSLSEEEARLATHMAYLDAFKQQVVAGLHQRGLAEMGPMHQKLLADIDQQQAEHKFRWQQLRAANTPTISRRVFAVPDAKNRDTLRKLGVKEYEAGIEDAADIRKTGRGLQKDIALEQAKQKMKAPAPGTLSEDSMRNLRSVGPDAKYQAARNMKPLVEKLQAIAREHGGKAPGVFGPFEIDDKPLLGPALIPLRSEAKEEWDRVSDAGSEILINFFTGAVASPDQRAIAEKAFGKKAVSAAERVRAINTLGEMLDNWINVTEGRLSDEERQFLHRNPGLAPISPSNVADTPARDVLEVEYEDE